MKRVAVLLATYNGEKYLKEQLNSLFTQSYKNFDVIVRDDGSSDETVKILQEYNVELLPADRNVGVKKSFSLLLEYALRLGKYDYFMFCDQDDVWYTDKIEKTLLQMMLMESQEGLSSPLLVHTDLKVIDKNLNTIASSFWEFEHLNPRFNSFNRLLMQNTVTGCTVMINRKLAGFALPIPEESLMHDWWLALVASAFGKISYIEEPLMLYRQHGSNSVGAKGFSFWAVWLKFYKVFIRNKKYWQALQPNILQAKIFLETFQTLIPCEDRLMLEEFCKLPIYGFWQRRKILIKYQLFKQGVTRNLGLLLKL